MTEKTVNYTDSQVESLSAGYLAGKSVEVLATELGKSVRSVVAKLASLGLYKSAEKAEAKTRVTKAAIVAGVAIKLGLSLKTVETLEKADKVALEALFKALP